MVKHALRECDRVMLFVSLKARTRPGEFPVASETVMAYWQDYLVPSMPGNVEVKFSAITPIRDIYDTLNEAEANAKTTTDSYVVYSDEEDLQANYAPAKRQRLWPTLLKQRRIEFKPVPRGLTGGISGTQMRSYLKLGLEDEFIDNLPEIVRAQGHDIWQLFTRQGR